jgi:hypothetical protein
MAGTAGESPDRSRRAPAGGPSPHPHGRIITRIVLAASVTVVAALILQGCIVINSVNSSQNGSLGPVHVKLNVCASGSGTTGPCTGVQPDPPQSNVQALVGFRIPAGSAAPASFDSTSTGPNNTGPQLHFTPSATYTSELQRLDPAPDGEQWQGYISQFFAYSPNRGIIIGCPPGEPGCPGFCPVPGFPGCAGFAPSPGFAPSRRKTRAASRARGPTRLASRSRRGPRARAARLIAGSEQSFTVEPEFGLPGQSYIPGHSTDPFAGPFNFRPVVGERYYSSPGPPPADDPVQCGSSLYARTSQGNYNIICVNDPAPTSVNTDLQQSTRDAVIVPGTPVTGQAGTLTTVPFQFKFAGTGAPAFTMNAGVNIPGAPAVPTPLTFTPGDNSTTTIPVGVAIPPGTPPGTYQVILAADLPDLEWRAVPAQLTVTRAAPAEAPAPPPPLPPSCRVPELRAMPMSNAVIFLHNASCALGTVTHRASTRVPRGQVIAQTPNPGTTMAVGTPVAIQVSSGRRHRRHHH